jgi:hypothetical protein
VINAEHPFASWFLLLGAAGFLAVYALPLLLVPLRWARWFQWPDVPEKDPLAVYLGRCTGGLAVALMVVAARAAPDPARHPDVFDFIALSSGLMTLIHVWGAIRRTQPWTEHAEIVLYGAVTGIAVWLRAALA